MLRIIEAKRDGKELSDAEIGRLIGGYAAGDVPDYQMSAFAMAVFINGMTPAETAALTRAMLQSGDVLAWDFDAPVVDKHSTGGIGDKVSIPLAPMLAACGVKVPMISGRGLGPTGGTLDKLEAVPGYRTDLSVAELRRVVSDVGCAITGASERIAPADRKLYALRDVTATVPSVPLITASILSKKLAAGLDALVLDVKFGSGAFMKTLAKARVLAESLCRVGTELGVKTTAVLTDMNQPLGRMIGNAVEIEESLAALQGGGPADLTAVTLRLGAELLVAAEAAGDVTTATRKLQQTIDSGSAREILERMVAAQGGDLAAPRPRGAERELKAPQTGYVAEIATEQLGWAIIELGGGRKKLGDPIDHSVGLEMLVRVGDQIAQGQPWLRMFESADADRNAAANAILSEAVTISAEPMDPLPLIAE